MATRPIPYRPAGEPGRPGQAETDDQVLVDALVEHHRGIEQAVEAIAAKAGGEHPPSLRAAYESLERGLLRHMELEERDLLPLYAWSHADDARELRNEHDVVREKLFEIGLALELHRPMADALNDLAILLRAHTAREELGLYPWFEQNISDAVWQTLALDGANAERLARDTTAWN